MNTDMISAGAKVLEDAIDDCWSRGDEGMEFGDPNYRELAEKVYLAMLAAGGHMQGKIEGNVISGSSGEGIKCT